MLPRSSFQKLGLAAGQLRTALSSVNSSLTSLRTDAGGDEAGDGKAERKLRPMLASEEWLEREVVNTVQWTWYVNDADATGGRSACGRLLSKKVYNIRKRAFERSPLTPGANGLAYHSSFFARGAERVAKRCTEICVNEIGDNAKVVGERLVAKETLYEQEMMSPDFHNRFAKQQAEAEEMAALFNARVSGRPEECIHFVSCSVYHVYDAVYNCEYWVLAEAELEGKFTKYNNNAGNLQSRREAKELNSMGVIREEGEDEEEEEEEEEEKEAWELSDVPQAFSHFTWSVSEGDVLICDLQGVWNAADGFTLTDPAIHRCVMLRSAAHTLRLTRCAARRRAGGGSAAQRTRGPRASSASLSRTRAAVCADGWA